MSIVIDMDMDMPKYCNECRFCTDSFGECDLKYENIPNYEFWSDKNEKPEWCPLKQIPKDDVLDKIRAEIENDWQLEKYPSSPFSCGLRRAIEIIDKYRESEE